MIARILVQVSQSQYSFQSESRKAAEKPISGLEKPPLIVIPTMPLVILSRLTPGIPSVCEVFVPKSALWSLVVVPRHADAEFGDQRIREKAIVIDADAVGVLECRFLKIPLCWSAGDAEDRGLENGGTLVAQARAQAILISEVASTLASTKFVSLLERAAAQSSCSCSLRPLAQEGNSGAWWRCHRSKLRV